MQLVYDYPEALLMAGRNVEAAAFAERQLARFTDDGPLHLIAARVRGTGQKLMQHKHQGEYYAWQGNLRGAIDQLEIATKSGDGDFYQASVVDMRLRTLRRENGRGKEAGFRTVRISRHGRVASVSGPQV